MRNDEDGPGYREAPPTRRCGHCGDPLLFQRKGAKYCDRRCKEAARAARKRASDRLTTLRSRYPYGDPPDLPVPVVQADEDQDDEAGLYGSYPGQGVAYDPDAAWAERMALAQAVEAIRARYERMLAPHRETLRRNVGAKPPAMARLERARDAEISEVVRAHEKREALAQAAREAPLRAVQAAERQRAEANLSALGRELPGGSRRYQAPLWTGRATEDLAVW